MRCEWVVSCSCLLMCMGLVIISINQHQVIMRLNKSHMRQAIVLETVDSAYKYDEAFKAKLEDLVRKGMTILNASSSQVGEVNPELKRNAETCLAEKEKKQHEMQQIENELNKIKGPVDAWNSDKKKLEEELAKSSIICNYVKKSAIVSKLCETPSNTVEKQ